MTDENKRLLKQAEDNLADVRKYIEEDEKCELTADGYYFNIASTVSKFTSHSNIKYGGTRATKELAEIASKNMTTRNRLEAWVHQIQGDNRGKYFINLHNDKYEIAHIAEYYNIQGTVYMTEDTAEWICERLNDGRIVL